MSYFVLVLVLLKFATGEDTVIKKSMMLVNDRIIDITKSNEVNQTFEYTGQYKFLDGELAKFTCVRDNTKFNAHIMMYRHQGNPYNFTSIDNNISSLYVKLKKKTNPEYIDCIIKQWYKTMHTVVIRIELYLEPNQDYPRFKINRLPLSPLIPNTPKNQIFYYEYYFGEKFNISIDTGNIYLYSMNCNSSDKIMKEKSEGISKKNNNYISLNTNDLVNRETTLKCYFYTSFRTYFIKLKLVRSEYPESYPQITGVSWTRVISKLTNTSIIREKIFYSYYDNESLVLNCSMNGNVKWIFNESEVIHSTLYPDTSIYNTGTNIFLDAQRFQLKNNVNNSVLSCTHNNQESRFNSQIELVRVHNKKDQVISVTTTPATSTIGYSSTNSYESSSPASEGSQSNMQNVSETEDDGLNLKKFYTIIGSVIAVIIISIILITLVVCRMKRKVIPKTELDLNYENLPEHNEGPMPTPSQWNTNEYANSTEALYTNLNNEPTYAKPIPKSKRNMLKETYSVPYNTSSESPYAEVVHSSQRNKKSYVNPDPQNPNYAQIIPKSQRNNPQLNKVLPTNDSSELGYSEVHGMRSRADTDKNKYANVFDKQRYVNAKPSDYIEPAYASVDSLK